MNVDEFVRLVQSISDDLGALFLIVIGSYIIITKDYNEGYALISLGVAYLFGSHNPKKRVVRLGE